MHYGVISSMFDVVVDDVLIHRMVLLKESYPPRKSMISCYASKQGGDRGAKERYMYTTHATAILDRLFKDTKYGC